MSNPPDSPDAQRTPATDQVDSDTGAAPDAARSAADPPIHPDHEASFTAAPPTPPDQLAPPTVSGRKQRVRGFVRHRATQLVAALVAGAVIGGGTVALVAAGGRDGDDPRGGHSVADDSGRGDPHRANGSDRSRGDDDGAGRRQRG